MNENGEEVNYDESTFPDRYEIVDIKVGVDDSEEFTKEELQEIKQLAEKEYNKSCGMHYAGGLRDLYDRIYYKANKMLKEKDKEDDGLDKSLNF